MLMKIRMDTLTRRDGLKLTFTTTSESSARERARSPIKKEDEQARTTGKERKKRAGVSSSPTIPAHLHSSNTYIRPRATQKANRLTTQWKEVGELPTRRSTCGAAVFPRAWKTRSTEDARTAT